GSAYCTCKPGYYSAGGVAGITTGAGVDVADAITTDTECAPCPAGQSSTSGASVCTSCPANTYSTSGGLCTACPTGTSSPEGASGCTTLSCPAGKRPVGNTCANCPAKTYSSAGDTSCTDCPPGSISSPGSSSCTPCPGGSVPSPSANSCSTCPRNTYSNGDNCSPCPAGSTSNPGSSSCGPQPSRRAVQPAIDTCSYTPGFQRCPVFNGGGGTECINVLTTLDSCGGCVGPDDDDDSFVGQDCSAIPNVDQVECEQGRCKIISCRAGYTLGEGTCSSVPPAKVKRAKARGRNSF
ncbi:Dihydroxyacetone synthase, partial [Ceratobasidium sp. 370]